MSNLLEQFKIHPMTCAILCLYSANIVWYLLGQKWGLAFYWCAAAQITVAATWLREWMS